VKTLYLFVAISSANHLAFMGVRLAVILYAVHLGASSAVVGVLAALFGLGASFVSVPAGRLMDRVGPALPMLWCSALMALGGALGYVWQSLFSMFVVSTLVGTFYSLFFVGHTQWIGRIGRPEERIRNFSLASLGFSGASFLGPLVTGFVIDHLGHPAVFLLLALVPLFPIAVLGLHWMEHPAGRGPRADKGAARGGVMALARDRRLARIYGVSVLANATWTIVGFLFPVYCAEIGLSASLIGAIMGAYSIASVVIRAFLPMLARRCTTWQLMLMSLSLTGLCFVIFPMLESVLRLVVLAFVIGLALGLCGPLSQALLYEASPPDRVGEVMGLRVTAMNITQTAVPLAAGAVSATLGVAPVFWALAAVLLGGSFVTRTQWRRGAGGQAAHRPPGAAPD
jgi:MFS family permease